MYTISFTTSIEISGLVVLALLMYFELGEITQTPLPDDMVLTECTFVDIKP